MPTTKNGFRCPKCGHSTSVLDSRPTVANMVRRKRVCDTCVEHTTTYEIQSGEYLALNRMRGKLREIKRILRMIDAA
jgi:transcriptional regulator NrdR family protein